MYAAPAGRFDVRIELASFRPDDQPCLVEASLSCPFCLGPVDWAMGADSHARCRCRHCGHRRAVALTDFQELRLRLDGDRVHHEE